MQTSIISAHEMLARATAAEGAESAMPRTLLVFAHPDDETIALGGRLRRFTGAHMVHVTDGAPQDGRDSRWHGFACVDDYRAARAEELRKALKTADLGDMSRECLGIPDQRAALQLVDLTHSTTQWIETHRPEIVFTHPYEGGHPDHDACSFAVHHARERCSQPVLVVESAFYHADPQEGTEAGVFLPGASADEMVYRLSPEEQERKAAILACFLSQGEVLAQFPLHEERFRIAPEYDFTRPVLDRPALYDQFAWAITSARFCDLAREAERTLTARTEAACR